MLKMLTFAGSTRADSFNKKLAIQAAYLAKNKGAHVSFIDLKDLPLPFCDPDEINKGIPQNATHMRQLMMQSDVIFIASPEYNGSLPAILKNMIDWVTRSEDGQPSREAFKGKKFALASTSPGAHGGKNGLQHLKAIIEAIGGTVIAQHITVPNSYTAFNESGYLKDPQKNAEFEQLIMQLISPAV